MGMKTEICLTRDDILRISALYKGHIRNEAGLETALRAGARRGVFKRTAYLWRAILAGSPFAEGDKRTAVAIAVLLLELSGRRLSDVQTDALIHAVIRASGEGITKVNKIERLLRYAVQNT
jgi:prophage maintenance system killer protein